MRLRGRIIQCGTAANASWTPVPTGPRPEREILTRRLRWSGFIIFDHIAEFEAAATRLIEFALDGKIVHDEEILPGLEHAPGAIAQLYRGDNHGTLRLCGSSFQGVRAFGVPPSTRKHEPVM